MTYKLKRYRVTDIRTGRSDLMRAKSRRTLDRQLGKRVDEVIVEHTRSKSGEKRVVAGQHKGGKNTMVDTFEREQVELEQLKTRRDILASELKGNRVARYIPMITTKGKLKGELSHLTIKQFKDFTGSDPRQSIIVDGKVPWHLALDTIATESGFKSDEAFRDAVLKAKDSQDELAAIKREIKGKREDTEKARKTIPKAEQAKLEGTAPVFPKQETTPEVLTEVNGLVMRRRRNPSFWQVESDTDGDKKPDTVVRIRYSDQAEKVVKEAVKDFQRGFAKSHRLTRKTPRITPKRPRLLR